jgi:ABC-2 type transport system ATP-binding protein
LFSEEEIISVKNLRKEFKVPQKDDEGFLSSIKQLFNRKYVTVTAVDDITMSVRKGEIRALIGPNGSGKSTTIKILTGTLYPTGGSVKVAGFVPWVDRKAYLRRIGVVTGRDPGLCGICRPLILLHSIEKFIEYPEKSTTGQ